MTFQERAERLKNHPDTVTVEIAGEERPWFLGKVTFDLAKARGLDLSEVLGRFETVGEDAGLAQLAPMIEHFGRLLYFGMLPFQEDLEESDITDFLSVADLPRLLPVLMDPLSDFADDEQGKAEAEAARKAQSARDRKKR